MTKSRKGDPCREPTAPRYFEYRDPSSDKFWEASVDGSSFVVRFGRRGTVGQTKRKEFATPDAARSACDTSIAEKLREGYQEKSPAGAPSSITYEVTLIQPRGRERELNVTTGKAVKLPTFERWDFYLREGVTAAQVQAIVADVNARAPKAVGVHGMGIDDSTLPLLRDLRNVVDLTVLGFDISDAGLKCIPAHGALESLGVQRAEGTTDAALAAVATLRRLKHLEFLISGSFTDSGLQKLAALENLEQLTLGELRQATDKGLRALEKLPKLTYASVRGPKLTKEGLERLDKVCLQNRKSGRAARSTPSAPGELSAAVLQELKRLGAKSIAPREFPEDAASWPKQILTLMYGLQWPRGARYSPSEDSPYYVRSVKLAEGEHWVNSVLVDYSGCDGRSFATWAQTDHHLILVDLESSDLSDPDVYFLDHEEMDRPLPVEVSASEFLAALERD